MLSSKVTIEMECFRLKLFADRYSYWAGACFYLTIACCYLYTTLSQHNGCMDCTMSIKLNNLLPCARSQWKRLNWLRSRSCMWFQIRPTHIRIDEIVVWLHITSYCFGFFEFLGVTCVIARWSLLLKKREIAVICFASEVNGRPVTCNDIIRRNALYSTNGKATCRLKEWLRRTASI